MIEEMRNVAVFYAADSKGLIALQSDLSKRSIEPRFTYVNH